MSEETMVQEKIELTEEELFQHLRALEAVLFTAQELQSEKDLSVFFPEGTDIGTLLEQLQLQYQNRGVNLVQRGKGWGFRTAPDLAERLEIKKIEIKPLSRAGIETLSIVAYHQPVTRAEVEQIRGVSISKSTFEILVAENLIKPGKRRDVVGRPLTWVTTQNFLDAFGLESLKQLPNLQELKEAGLLSMSPPQFAGQDMQAELPLASEDMEIEDEETEAEDDSDFDFPEDETGENA
jgi:segregation and condensation protein B